MWGSKPWPHWEYLEFKWNLEIYGYEIFIWVWLPGLLGSMGPDPIWRNQSKSGLGTLHCTVQFICTQKLELHAIQLRGCTTFLIAIRGLWVLVFKERFVAPDQGIAWETWLFYRQAQTPRVQAHCSVLFCSVEMESLSKNPMWLYENYRPYFQNYDFHFSWLLSEVLSSRNWPENASKKWKPKWQLMDFSALFT